MGMAVVKASDKAIALCRRVFRVRAGREPGVRLFSLKPRGPLPYTPLFEPIKKNLTALGPSLLLAIRTRYSWYGYWPSKTARTSANAWKGLNGEAISTLK